MSKTRFLLVTMSFTPFCLSAIIPTHIDRRQVLETAPDLPYTWFYKGCFVDRIGDRTLKRATTRSLDMTGGQCVRWCLERGYNFAGTEWGKECFCGFQMHDPVLTRDEECWMPCAGWAGEACGGSQRITVYETLDADPPATNPGVPAFPLLGCYTEPVGGARALSARVPVEGGLTVAKCTAACANRGFALAGVEYGRECFCGNALGEGSDLIPGDADATGCDMVCSGSSREFCGGPNRLNLYGVLPTPSPTPTPEPTPEVGPTTEPTVEATSTPLATSEITPVVESTSLVGTFETSLPTSVPLSPTTEPVA